MNPGKEQRNSSEQLVGGAPKRGRKRSGPEQLPPPMIGLRFFAILFLSAGTLTGLGLLNVGTVFSARDFEMETGRVQRIARERHDRQKALEARLGELRSADSLRASAMGTLGMAEPDPQLVTEMIIQRDSSQRWTLAADTVHEEVPSP
jgi:hypothetical protein